jgi:hypothetical protein
MTDSQQQEVAQGTPRDICDAARSHLDPQRIESLTQIADTLNAARFAPPGTVAAESINDASIKADQLRDEIMSERLDRQVNESKLPTAKS